MNYIRMLTEVTEKFKTDDRLNSTHICRAYRIIDSTMIQEKASDDGEPRGSAGMSILNELKRSNIVNIGMFVVRYYGGRKLGIPGLIHSYTETTKIAISNNSLSNWEFKLVLGQREGVPCKPDPAGMLDICEQLKIPAEKFLYLGDTATDMKTATSAGCFPVGVLWGFRPEAELRDNGARAIVKKPLDVLDLLI